MPAITRMSMSDLDFEIEKKAVDTILVAFSDLQGRLVGRRITVDFFRSALQGPGLRVPASLLCTDAYGRPANGFALASAGNGFPDLVLRVDPETLFRMPWQPGTAGVLGDLELPDGSPVIVSPRAILKRQAQRVDGSSLSATIGLEQQFTAFDERHADAMLAGFSGLSPAGTVGAGHVAFLSGRSEPLLHRVREAGTLMPLGIEGTAALTSPGSFEVTLAPADALPICDGALVLRSAIKDIAAQEGRCATFMPSYEDHAGTACHVSMSLRGLRGGMALADRNGEAGLSEIGKAFIAGQLHHAAELCLLYAPSVNSYRRFSSDPVSPSAVNWGPDNRTCAIRVIGADASLRVENRIPASDANPYLAVAAMIAAGLDGMNHQLQLPAGITGDGHDAGSPALPATLDEALGAWTESVWVRETFGTQVQEHYANLARVEIESTGASPSLEVERARYFDAS